MNRRNRSWKLVLGRATVTTLALGGPAAAADLKLPVKAPHVQAVFDWTGFYIGAHAGYSRGSSSAVLSDPAARYDQQHFQRHDRRRAGRLQLSAVVRTAARRRSRHYVSELSHLEFGGFLAGDAAIRCQSSSGTMSATVRGRIGYAAGPWLAYATGGLAFAGERFLNSPADRQR